METMKTKNILGLIVMTIALAVFIVAPVSAFADIVKVEVNDVEVEEGVDVIGAFAGEVVEIKVTFVGNDEGNKDLNGKAYEEDARLIARILGEPGSSVISERFNVIEGNRYTKTVALELPFDLDENKEEPFGLEITLESNRVEADVFTVDFDVQRSNFELEVLSVDSDTEVQAGEVLVLDVVIKNRGFDEAEDTFIQASIPELGISRRVFLGDLTFEDHDDPEKFDDSDVGRIFLRIPTNTAAGVYTVEIETFNDDAKTIVTKKVVVTGAGEGSRVVSSGTSKTFAVGATETYSLTIVNAGTNIGIYELVLESDPELRVVLDAPVVAIPAGSSSTVKMTVSATESGIHNFAVNVHSDGRLVKRETFSANVEGRGITAGTGNSAVLLTVILAIIFVVLLIVLIVLLTRRPEKSEEFGESYY